MKITGLRHWWLALAAGLALVNCTGGSDSESSSHAVAGSSTTTEEEGSTTAEGETAAEETSTVSKNALAAAFPGTLALSVFPEGNGASLRLEDAFDPNGMTMAEKAAEQEKIASGEAESCLPEALSKQFTKGSDETCYEFDQDMIYGSTDTSLSSVRWLGTRNGKASNGEACLVAFTRNQVSQVVTMVDQTLGLGMAAICQYRKLNGAETALPEVGKSIDLKAALEDLFGSKVTVSSATLERLDDANDRPVYNIEIHATMGKDSFEREIGIIHSPADDDNKEYSGTIYTVMAGVPSFSGGAKLALATPAPSPAPAPAPAPSPAQSPAVSPAQGPAVAPAQGAAQPSAASQVQKYQLLSITYQRTVDDSGQSVITADLRSAQMHPDIAKKAINAYGVLDYNTGTDVTTGTLGGSTYGNYTGFSQSNEAVDGITFIAFNLNTDTNEGTLAYWKNPGGNYYENARGFNISIDENEAGELEGCATSGAASTDFNTGISIRRYLNEREAGNKLTLTPKGFWHPFMNNPTSSGTNSTGDYKRRAQQGTNQQVEWYVPLVADAALGNTFISSDSGSLISRQCFKRNSSGVYEIDTAKISAAAGFELLDTGSSVNAAKFIALPDAVKPPTK